MNVSKSNDLEKHVPYHNCAQLITCNKMSKCCQDDIDKSIKMIFDKIDIKTNL